MQYCVDVLESPALEFESAPFNRILIQLFELVLLINRLFVGSGLVVLFLQLAISKSKNPSLFISPQEAPNEQTIWFETS